MSTTPVPATRPSAAPPVSPRVARPWVRVALVLAPLVALTAIAWAGLDAWSRRLPTLTPRHRAEALCFALAQPPVFDPPMVVEPSSARVPDRFAPGTDASLALRELMHFDEGMVLAERATRFGDFDVTTLWLVLPPGETARHWLVVGWMEDGDLLACTFRFAGTDRELSPEERAWGDRLLQRILRPEYFRAGAPPRVTLRAREGRSLPAFGPD